MNYLEKYHLLHSYLSYHALDLGYGYWTTATGGTIYLFFPESNTRSCNDDLQTIIDEHQLLTWPAKEFKENVKYKRLHDGLGPHHLSGWPYAYVFHLWKGADREKLEAVVETIKELAEQYNDHDEEDSDESLREFFAFLDAS